MSRRLHIAVISAIAATLATTAVAAPQQPASASLDNRQLTLERIYDMKQAPLTGRLPRSLQWRPGREAWVFVEREGKGKDATETLVQVEAASGSRTTLADDTTLTTAGTDGKPLNLRLRGFTFSPDGDALLLSHGDDLYLYALERHSLDRLATGPGAEESAAFSPDGSRIAYVRDNDLYAYDLASAREVRITSDGSETVRNGAFDWVYWEELADHEERSFVWSPEGTRLAWLRLDDRPIQPFHILDVMDTHSSVREQRYPKAGDPTPVPTVHIVWFEPDMRIARRTQLTFAEPLPYVPRLGFTPDGGDLWYQVLEHDQDHLHLMALDLATGATRTLLDENDPYWVEPVDMMHFMRDGSFLWASRRSGFMHLELHRPGGAVTDLTPGPSVVTSLVGVDEDAGVVFYQAARPTPMERRVFTVRLAGGSTTEITADHGSHRATLSPGHAHLMVTSSSITRSPHVELYSAAGKHLRTVAANPTPELDAMKLGRTRFVTVPADDGTPLNALLLTPPGFDPAKRYPVVTYVYGGPHAQTVRDGSGRSTALFHQWLATHGFIVFSLDNRGSFARGREFEGAVNLKLGSSQLPDQLAGVRWLKEQPYVDGHRIGIWGWSYGGYFTTYALTHAPGVFAAGAAVAPVTDWALYDSIYTERYMGTPEENPDGYRAGSVLEAVDDLADPLLVIHGTGDDNVHFQNTLQLAQQAWQAGKRFDLMLFPNLKHGIYAPGSRLQVFRAIAAHFQRHLGGDR